MFLQVFYEFVAVAGARVAEPPPPKWEVSEPEPSRGPAKQHFLHGRKKLRDTKERQLIRNSVEQHNKNKSDLFNRSIFSKSS